MHVCMCARICACMCACVHIGAHTHTARAHPLTQSCTHAHVHTVHTCARARAQELPVHPEAVAYLVDTLKVTELLTDCLPACLTD